MIINQQGRVVFTDEAELMYNFLITIGFGVNNADVIYDQDTMCPITFAGKPIKVCVDANRPVYASKNDVILNLSCNLSIFMTLFGYYLDKKRTDEDMEYVSHYSEDLEGKTRLVIKHNATNSSFTSYYLNKSLMYIDMMMGLEGFNPFDLSNFDIPLEMKK